MKVCVVFRGEPVLVEVDADTTVENLKAVLEAETNVPAAQQRLTYFGREVFDDQTLAECGVEDQDMLDMARREGLSPRHPHASAGPHHGQAPSGPIPPPAPAPAPAPVGGGSQSLMEILMRGLQQQQPSQQQQQQPVAAPGPPLESLDPLDPEFQRRCEEFIQQENINESYAGAMEHIPEFFARVTMLYIDASLNGHNIKAFVDTGAQTTIMSKSLAERCGIMRLVDRRFAGVARGVGTAPIVGRIHLAQIKLGSTFFPVSIMVLEESSLDFIFGLDMMKRHQAIIDLGQNCLIIGEDRVPFLPEHEIPLSERTEENGVEEEPSLSSAASTSNTGSNPDPSLSSSAAAGGAPVGSGPESSAWESTVQELMQFGFGREQVEAVLRSVRGNKEAALALLFES